MTPKEKAKNLDSTYWNKLFKIQSKITPTELAEQSKQCALICADEILQTIPKEVMSYNPFMMNTDYWKEVKQEINKL